MGYKFTLHIAKISKKQFHKVIRLNNLNIRLCSKINVTIHKAKRSAKLK